MHTKLLKPLLWLLGLCLLAYALICAYMFSQQRHMIYQGDSTRVAAEQTNFSLQQGDVTLRGWQGHPDQLAAGVGGVGAVGGAAAPARDAVIYLGGNAERLEQVVPLLRQWLPAHSAYALAYRGYGASDGTPTGADLERDAIALFDAVQQLHPQGRITVVGRRQ